MRKTSLFFLLGLVLFGWSGRAQDASVEKRTNGIQAGIFGLWFHHERLLAPNKALRFEFGLDAGFWGGTIYPKTGYVVTPVIAIEPRLYYNLFERAQRSRRTEGNSGSFITMRTAVHPAWFYFSNYGNVRVVSDVSFVPTWGIRRAVGGHLTYEAGLGLGYQYYFAKRSGYDRDYGEAVLNLHLRLGYRF